MADPRFFRRSGPFTLKELAEIAGAEIRSGDADAVFDDVAPLHAATQGQVSFLDNKAYADAFRTSAAGACIVSSRFADQAPGGMALLVTEDPYGGYARVAQAYYPQGGLTPGVHAAAVVADGAVLGAGCQVDAGAVIGEGAEIGADCWIGSNSTIGPGVVIGDGCRIGPNVTIQFAVIGKDCVFHPGVRIGQDGFGFAPGARHLKVPQLGRVVIGDDVDIGANACIDRGAGPDTVIRTGTKIDNLVQIGHNVEIGSGCLFAAQSGLSGSTKIGNYVMMGGQVGSAGHLNIGDGARIAAQSGLMRDVEPGQTVVGSPAQPAKEYWRQLAALGHLARAKTKKGADT
ncbi:MAG: UDP-3-O-(3-hydroxymyristoyl)glucosamine N-acyltransferase [Alphaproteobacteria bacterium]|nr:UDP-3-O-(3-hydroxymyristoyl)glucosamine N-acyltransferase [Alphaproteobacteria bacterium]MBF0249474.1 UDP-3-O-(3-hydroxymyristoyl)glucosamine N-acyltransferase [Alphaproteobacteria bacterium]